MTQNIKKDKNLYKILGPVGSHLITELTQSKTPVFSLSEASKILNSDNRHVKKLLHDLVKKGWLQRIERGKYILIPLIVDATKPYTVNQFLIASKLIAPYYIGFWSMLHYYGYTEQLLNTVFVVSTKRKENLYLSGINYKFVKTTEKKMFGLIEIKIEDIPVKVSDKEKTLLDCLDHPEYCGGITEVVKGIWNARGEIDYEKMFEYAKKMSNSAIAKRLGYILEILELDKKMNIKSLKKFISKGYSPLDPLLPKQGRYDSRWNILVNISKEELLSFRRV
jgi:predicted transcriptional regulator of viral defense system